MKNFRFIDWPVYEDSKKLFNISLRFVDSIPQKFKFNVGEQLLRASLSVSLNIAEGSGKHSDKDFNHFLNISLGSLNETVAIVDILKDNRLISRTDFEEIVDVATNISNQLGGLKKKLKSAFGPHVIS